MVGTRFVGFSKNSPIAVAVVTAILVSAVGCIWIGLRVIKHRSGSTVPVPLRVALPQALFLMALGCGGLYLALRIVKQW